MEDTCYDHILIEHNHTKNNMGNFKKFDKPRDGKKGGFDRGRGGFGGERKFGGKNDGPKQKFDATCGACGRDCQVPFRPTGKHPVFCSDCFRNQKDGGSSSYNPKKSFGGGRDSFERHPSSVQSLTVASGITKEQFSSLEKKLDSILSLLHTQRRDEEFTKETADKKISPTKKKGVKKPAPKTKKTPPKKMKPAKKK